ncbi:MAG: hypothetical protein FWC26_04245 [Fibromonadales bacterium]|nr:hypothetical protein [Fibromonadales bacterium]
MRSMVKIGFIIFVFFLASCTSDLQDIPKYETLEFCKIGNAYCKSIGEPKDGKVDKATCLELGGAIAQNADCSDAVAPSSSSVAVSSSSEEVVSSSSEEVSSSSEVESSSSSEEEASSSSEASSPSSSSAAPEKACYVPGAKDCFYISQSIWNETECEPMGGTLYNSMGECHAAHK